TTATVQATSTTRGTVVVNIGTATTTARAMSGVPIVAVATSTGCSSRGCTTGTTGALCSVAGNGDRVTITASSAIPSATTLTGYATRSSATITTAAITATTGTSTRTTTGSTSTTRTVRTSSTTATTTVKLISTDTAANTTNGQY